MLALLPSLALGDYIAISYYSTQGPWSQGQSCACNASSLAYYASYQAGGCTAGTSSSSLIACVNSTYYTSSFYTNTACSGTTSSSQGSDLSGCSCSSGSISSATCVTSSSNLPSLDYPLVKAFFGGLGKCPSTDPTVLPSISAATSVRTFRGCSVGAILGGLPYYGSVVCGAWGAVFAIFSDASCSGTPLFTSPYTGINISTCSYSSGEGTTAHFCTAPTAAAPDTIFSARTIPTCKGAINPAPLPTATLTCYEGFITSSGSNISYIFPGGIPTDESDTSAPSVACYAATVSCSQQLLPNLLCDSPSTMIRFFGGASSAADLASLSFLQRMGGMAPPRDLYMCTGNKCNSPSPAVDACAIVSPPYTHLTCGAPPATTAASSPITCYSNLGSGSTLTPTLQIAAQPGALACGASTINCPGFLSQIRSSPPRPNSQFSNFTPQVQRLCLGVTGAVRLYGDNVTLSLIPPQLALKGLFSPSFFIRAYVNDLVVCTAPGCNNPATDACALASAPVSVTVSFSGLPDSAADASGKLTPAAVTLLTASLSTAVQSSACATCSVTVTKVVDTSKNTVVYSASRRRELALSALAVTFDVAGASTQTLAGVAAASTAPAFSQAATKALVSTGGSAYASVAVSVAPASATSAGSSSPALIGLVGLVGLLFVGLAVYCVCIKKKAAAGKVVAMPQQGTQV
jgi:hypothetical protein